MSCGGRQGERVRQLLASCRDRATIVAPFIKVDAFENLIEAVSGQCHIRCVTRWLPRDVMAGVSDPEVLAVLATRGNGSLFLVDNLHAKLYVADRKCLVGSSNVTRRGLGQTEDGGNIEVMVESTVDDPGVRATLDAIGRAQRLATEKMADDVRRLAGSLRGAEGIVVPGSATAEWLPRSVRPYDGYRLYNGPPMKFVSAADKVLLADIARADCQPGLDEAGFCRFIGDALVSVPIIGEFLKRGKGMLRCVDAHEYLAGQVCEDCSVEMLWRALVEWAVHFLPNHFVRQEISEVALRHGRLG